MTTEQKIKWMEDWCERNGLELELEGEVGFGRPAVGVIGKNKYPDYHWYDEDTFEQEDENGEVWCPPDSYHKHPCVAVLGRGDDQISQLYDWLKWFEDNGFKAEITNRPKDRPKTLLERMIKGLYNVRMVRK